ncbi:MAG TPA: DUF2851 family protein [Puia sp.]|nr:DUF2851 family protein [Puia sp.]
MKESLLQWIWQYQYFNFHDLQTARGEPLQILFPGHPNTDQGPDMLDARIKIGDTSWAGTVELHVAASDWGRHAHREDKNYRNVILHVVWVDDTDAPALSGEREVPTLVLEHRVSKWLLQQYETWMKSRDLVPCQQQLKEVEIKTWESWKAQLIERRLQRRAGFIAADLEAGRQHWEETCWWLMAKTMGGPVNAAAFEMIARSLPLTTLVRLGQDQLEALLLGHAGLLEGVFRDEHPRRLQQEFHHLRVKYTLPAQPVPVHFLRMRPGNFPTIRLAQLARLLKGTSFWFSQCREAGAPGELKELMEVTAGSYWDDHYIPDKPSARRVKRLGEGLKDSLLINVFIPLLYAYGILRNEPEQREKAKVWLRALPAEKNALIQGWTRLGVKCYHAGDSQALLELKKHYCDQKSCLQCAIGKEILGRQVN